MKHAPPASQGYAMPAEWFPHAATWLSWPHPDGLSFPGSYEAVLDEYVDLIAAIARFETVRINVRGAEEREAASRRLRLAPMERIEFFEIPTNEPWCRDHGPIFLRREKAPGLLAINFGFNAWGWKLAPFEEDDMAARKIGEAAGVPVLDFTDFILEGGSIDVNGAGTCLTTESCLLNPNRNPENTRESIEGTLRDYLGVEQVVWLGDGIQGDDTDGHVDDIARFVSEDTVLIAMEENEEDENHEPLKLNFERLKGMSLPDGRPIHVRTLPMPPKMQRYGQTLPASYANFYIANGAVFLPVFDAPSDKWATAVLADVFPDREVVPVSCKEIIWGLGAVHCLTQQQPLT